jgi:hypothetical protein
MDHSLAVSRHDEFDGIRLNFVDLHIGTRIRASNALAENHISLYSEHTLLAAVLPAIAKHRP